MKTFFSVPELTLRRDRSLTDLVGEAALGVDLLRYTYVVEAADEVVMRVTNDFTMSQALLGSFGGFSLGIVDTKGSPQLLLKHEAGLTSPIRFFDPTGAPVAQTKFSSGEGFLEVVDPSDQVLLSVARGGNLLYPTYTCSAGGREVAVIDAKFNGLSEVFNKTTRYEIKVTGSDATERQRLLVLGVGVFIDVRYGSSA